MAPDHTVQSSITADELRECQRAKLAAQARNSTNVVLKLDSETGETLDVWYWCVSQIVRNYIEYLTHYLDPGQLTITEHVSSLLTS